MYKDNKLLKELAIAINKTFSREVNICPLEIPLWGGFDQLRNQVNSSWLLGKLNNISSNNDDKVLGIIDEDLFIPIFTFVFGEAEFFGEKAIISTHRFKNEFYGLSPQRGLLRSRLIKESIHELGHTFGLHHCHNQNCVMQSSSYAEEIDFKSNKFCQQCESMIPNNVI